MIKINVPTQEKNQITDITEKIEKEISKLKIEDGICVIFCPHTTCSVSINENADYTVKKDLLTAYKQIVPENLPYEHSEGNSTAHIKNVMTGSSVTLFIEKGRLALGTWQGIYFCEFDGPRNREIWIKTIREK